MRKRFRNPKMKLNLQFFADDPANQGGNQDPPANSPANPPANDVSIDYDRIQKMLDGTLAAKENTALTKYFEQQGLSKEEIDKAIATFKEQKAANKPDVNAMQQQVTLAQQQAQAAQIERDAYLLSGEIGVDLNTMPYLLKMADLSAVVTEGKVDKDKLKEALNKVLEAVPQLKTQAQTQQQGFRYIGVPGTDTPPASNTQAAVPQKKWNRFNN